MSPPPQAASPSTTAPIPAHDHERSDATLNEEVGTFNGRRWAHYQRLLHEKWNCSLEGHTICVPTTDNQHFQLKEHNIHHWVEALCSGRATTASPPHSVFEDIAGGGQVFNRTTGKSTVYAVSVAPSRRRYSPHHHPVEDTARSIDSIVTTQSPAHSVSFGNSTTNTASTSVSSGVPGPGYYGGKALQWLGEKGLDTIQHAMITRRKNLHTSLLQRWAKLGIELKESERAKVFEMLGDALEMCWGSYSTAVNNHGYAIGRSIHHWLYAYNYVPESPDTFWLVQVQVSLVPILLTRISRVDSLAGDLAHRILAEITKAPLAVQNEETSVTVIRLISHELAYARCAFQHSWLGIWLLRIIEMSLRVRSLSPPEITAIKELVARREEQLNAHNAKPERGGVNDHNGKEQDFWRPWEVALFAQCASQDTSFKDAVTGPHGLPCLVGVLDSRLATNLTVHEIHWEYVAITLRSLAFLSEQEWVAEWIETAEDPPLIRSLVQVFRRSIPERWFCIRFWAADTMRNMVAHRPKLAKKLLREDAVSALDGLSNPQLDHTLSADSFQREPIRVQVPPVPPTPPTPTPTVNSEVSPSTIPHTPNGFLSPLPTHELQLSCTSSPESPSPITPSPGTGRRRFSFRSSPNTPPFIKLSLPKIRKDRRASMSSNEAIPSVHHHAVSAKRINGPPPRKRRPPPSLIPTPAQERLLKDYKIEATKRAAELATYLRNWSECALELPSLEALGAGVGWLSSWEAEGWTIDVER